MKHWVNFILKEKVIVGWTAWLKIIGQWEISAQQLYSMTITLIIIYISYFQINTSEYYLHASLANKKQYIFT